jgi:hypothetical protein
VKDDSALVVHVEAPHVEHDVQALAEFFEQAILDIIFVLPNG